MKKTIKLKPSIQKIKETTSRTSLMLVLCLFVFCILLAAVLMTIMGTWGLSKAGVFLNVNGELQVSSVVVFMSVISIVIGSVIAFFSSRIPLRPVNELINKMNRLAAGDFKTRLKFGDGISSHAVAKELTASFNTMAEELENTALLRNDFINNFSHEFKTPIVSIMGLANLLEKGNLTEEQKVLYLRSIREESMRLSSMATNVMNLTKVENQTILTDITKFNLSEQLRSVVLLLENKWVKKNIDLQLEFEEISIEANEELLKEVWINLLDNAVKFVPDGGTIGVEITDTAEEDIVNGADSEVRIKIFNTGSEIPPEKQKRIFNKFYQADESHATKGNGIGLAIVKRIVDLHTGDVFVESENGVTAFTVILPKNQ